VTAAAVDLVAVQRARKALRALARAHPELTTAAAQNRAAAWLHDEEHDEMSRKLNEQQEGAAEQVGVRLSPELLARLDAEAARLAEQTATPFTRSMVVRAVLSRHLPKLDAPAAPARGSATPRSTSPSSTRSTSPSSKARAQTTEEHVTEEHVTEEHVTEGDEAHAAPARQPAFTFAANDHDRRNAAQAAMLLDEGADDRHARRSAEHTAAAALRAEIAALNMSARGIAAAMTAAGFPLSDRAVSQFVSGATAGLPRWADKFRAWRASVK